MSARLSQVSIGEIVPEGIQGTVVERNHMDGNVSEREIEIISRLVAYLKPHSVFEFGTFDGRTAINLAVNAPADAKVYTLDLPASQACSTKYALASVGKYSDLAYIQKGESGALYKGKAGSEKIIQLYGDSATFDYESYRGKMDLVFVDGSHSRQYTENDTAVALSMVRLGGAVIWHDYASVWPDVTAVLEEYAGRDARCARMVHIKGTTLAIMRF